MAEKWNSALSIDVAKFIQGTVCFLHFGDECFTRRENGKITKRTELKANSVPTIFEIHVDKVTEVSSNLGNSLIDADDLINPLSTLTFATPKKNLVALPSNLSLTPPSVITSSSPTLTSTVATVATSNVQSSSHCIECIKKDKLIDIRDAQIRELRKTLKKVQKKVWYLETVRKKLDATLSEMKKQLLLDEELSRSIEVCNLYQFVELPRVKIVFR